MHAYKSFEQNTFCARNQTRISFVRVTNPISSSESAITLSFLFFFFDGFSKALAFANSSVLACSAGLAQALNKIIAATFVFKLFHSFK